SVHIHPMSLILVSISQLTQQPTSTPFPYTTLFRSNLAAQPTHGQSVSTVWGDIDVEDRISAAQQRERVLTNMLGKRFIQGDNALRLRGQTKLRCRANHAIGNMVISLARGNLETTRQNRTGQRNRHDRAFFKITSTTDNALQLTCAVGVADVNLAITNRLFELS